MARAYYNEIDKFAAEWLRNLISAGHIAPGDVDERDIRDVKPSDLKGYAQCHFFAGIGVWSYALRLSGWGDDRSVWTGSCPCQPFSAAGSQAGFSDERHLWPSWHHLIEQCRPAAVLGEQVASKPAELWIDLVQADMEALGYAFGAKPFPAAGLGAPHIRDRLYWLAYASPGGRRKQWDALVSRDGGYADGSSHTPGQLGDARAQGLSLRKRAALVRARRREEGRATEQPSGASGVVADAEHGGRAVGQPARRGTGAALPQGTPGIVADAAGSRQQRGWSGDPNRRRADEPERLCDAVAEPVPGPTNGFWHAADWLLCRDGRWRPVEPGTFPLAYGVAGRVGQLRAYGNAIVAPQAAEFVAHALNYIDAPPHSGGAEGGTNQPGRAVAARDRLTAWLRHMAEE